MIGTRIHLQVLHLPAAEGATRNHALDRLLEQALRVRRAEDLAPGPLLDAAGMAGVPVELLFLGLVAGQLHLAGIDDDDVVAVIDVRGVGRLVLAAQPVGHDRREAAENDALGVDQDPLLRDLRRLRRRGLLSEAHGSLKYSWSADRSSADRGGV